MTKSKVMAAAVVVAAGLLLAAQAVPVGGQQSDKASVNGIDGKFLHIVMKDRARNGYALEKVQVRQLGNRWFLVGKVMLPEGTLTESNYWLPVDDVKEFAEFATREQLRRALRGE